MNSMYKNLKDKNIEYFNFGSKINQGLQLAKYAIIMMFLMPAVMFLWPSAVLSGPAALILIATVPLAIVASYAGKFMKLWLNFISF